MPARASSIRRVISSLPRTVPRPTSSSATSTAPSPERDRWRRPHVVHDRGAHVVDEDHAGPHESHRPAVRVPTADRRGGVDHGRHAGVDQAVGGDAVDVGVVDDGDVARLQALDEVLGALAHPGATDHLAVGRRAGAVGGASASPLGGGAGEQLLGVVVAGVAVRQAREHPGDLAHSGRLRRATSARTTVVRPSSRFTSDTWASAKAATCGRWVTTSTCLSAGQRRQRPADGSGRGAADARRRPRRTPGWAPGPRPPGAGRASCGPARRRTPPSPAVPPAARVEREQERHVVGGVVGTELDRPPRPGAGPAPRRRSRTAAASSGAACRRAAPTTAAAAATAPAPPAAAPRPARPRSACDSSGGAAPRARRAPRTGRPAAAARSPV